MLPCSLLFRKLLGCVKYMGNLKNFDVLIIGGGASGLMCALAAKNKNRNIAVAIIEKNDRVGKKLLSTGNGRCNLTNQNISKADYVGSFAEKSDYIFKKYTTEYLLNIFKDLGLVTFCDNEGRYYPMCKQASAVLDVLRFGCERLDVKIFCGENIKKINKKNGSFVVQTENTEFISEKLVISNGSKAAPKLGGNASASDYIKNFRHTFTPFSPALCPIKVKSDVLKSLKGIRATGKVSLFDKNEKIKSEIGEIQFTDCSLSGICIFNLSLYSKCGDYIIIDLTPDISLEELYSVLQKQKILFKNLTTENLFTGILQKRLGQAILKISGINDFSRLISTLNNDEIKKICGTVKNMKFQVIENCGFEQAQCAKGGVLGNEINEKNMESKIVKGLYICGEAIDICGKCGGYNLHFAFSSGHLAGENL